MKNKDTDEVIFVVLFTLLYKEDVEKEEAEAEAEAAKAAKPGESKQDGAKQGEEEDFEPQADDLD